MIESLLFKSKDKPGTRFALLTGDQPQDEKKGLVELNLPKNQSIALIRPLVKGEKHD